MTRRRRRRVGGGVEGGGAGGGRGGCGDDWEEERKASGRGEKDWKARWTQMNSTSAAHRWPRPFYFWIASGRGLVGGVQQQTDWSDNQQSLRLHDGSKGKTRRKGSRRELLQGGCSACWGSDQAEKKKKEGCACFMSLNNCAHSDQISARCQMTTQTRARCRARPSVQPWKAAETAFGPLHSRVLTHSDQPRK